MAWHGHWPGSTASIWKASARSCLLSLASFPHKLRALRTCCSWATCMWMLLRVARGSQMLRVGTAAGWIFLFSSRKSTQASQAAGDVDAGAVDGSGIKEKFLDLNSSRSQSESLREVGSGPKLNNYRYGVSEAAVCLGSISCFTIISHCALVKFSISEGGKFILVTVWHFVQITNQG